MIAKFIGQSSMGFITGRIYDVKYKVRNVRKGGSVFGKDMVCICLYDKNSNAWCPYESLKAIMDNWIF